MDRNRKPVSVSGLIVLSLVLLTATALQAGFVCNPAWYKVLFATLPLLLIAGLRYHSNRSATAAPHRD